MSKKYDELTRTEKIERIVEMPGAAVDLIDGQKKLIGSLERQVDIQAKIISLLNEKILAMEGGDR